MLRPLAAWDCHVDMVVSYPDSVQHNSWWYQTIQHPLVVGKGYLEMFWTVKKSRILTDILFCMSFNDEAAISSLRCKKTH